ncbi:hypothetical protein GCM10019017_21140 [Streptomyces showdoensis]
MAAATAVARAAFVRSDRMGVLGVLGFSAVRNGWERRARVPARAAADRPGRRLGSGPATAWRRLGDRADRLWVGVRGRSGDLR